MSDLKKFRKANNLTQKDAADFFGCTQGFISQIEKGVRPIPVEFISKATLALKGRDASDLLVSEGGVSELWPEVEDKDAQASGPIDSGDLIISTGKVIPYYDAEVAAGTSYGMDMTPGRPSGMIEIGGLMKDSEFALRVYGNSMTPNYPSGCVIGLKPHTDNFIEPGTVYVVETTDNRYLKRLYYSKDKSAFRCISDNTMKHENGPMTGEYYYQEFEIPLSDISRLLRVTGVIKRNIL